MEREELELNLRKIVESHELELYRISFEKDEGMDVFHIELDGAVDLDKCELISKEIGDFLEINDCFDKPYILDVCSVGLEREIKIEDLNKNLDAYVYVLFSKSINNLHEIEGYLKEVTDTQIKIEYLDKTRKKYFILDKQNIEFMRNAVKF